MIMEEEKELKEEEKEVHRKEVDKEEELEKR